MFKISRENAIFVKNVKNYTLQAACPTIYMNLNILSANKERAHPFRGQIRVDGVTYRDSSFIQGDKKELAASNHIGEPAN